MAAADNTHGETTRCDHSSRLIASSDPTIQQLFADALAWCHGFHHEYATGLFTQLHQQAPACPLVSWGIVHSLSPFYNRPWDWFNTSEQHYRSHHCHELLSSARATAAPPRNAAETLALQLVDAALQLWPDNDVVDNKRFQQRQHVYARQLRHLADEHPGLHELQALAVEASINCYPWRLWCTRTGDPLADGINALLQRLQHALASTDVADVVRAALLHLRIHALEMSPAPELAAASAAALRELPMALPHLLHMPTHIDMLLGRYADAVTTNDTAINADQRFVAQAVCNPATVATADTARTPFYLISMLHNHHLKMAAAMLCGQAAAADHAAASIRTLVTEHELQQPDRYLVASLDGFLASCHHVHIRFGRWLQLLAADDAQTADAVTASSAPFTTALICYARALAAANLQKRQAAERWSAEFESSVLAIPEWYIVNNNPAHDVIAVATSMLEGERLYHSGQHEQAFTALRCAVTAADALQYCEPWAWMHPPRHALGALLLAQDEIDEAFETYLLDLGLDHDLRCRYPEPMPLRGTCGDARLKTTDATTGTAPGCESHPAATIAAGVESPEWSLLMQRAQRTSALPPCRIHPYNIWSLHGLHECLVRRDEPVKAAKIADLLAAARKIADVPVNASCCCRPGSSAR